MPPIAPRAPALLLLTLTSLCLLSSSSGQDAAPAASAGRWLGPDDRPLPFATAENVLAFLRAGEVMSEKELSGGTNRRSR